MTSDFLKLADLKIGDMVGYFSAMGLLDNETHKFEIICKEPGYIFIVLFRDIPQFNRTNPGLSLKFI